MENTLVVKDRKTQLKNKTCKHKKEPRGNVRTEKHLNEIHLINGLNDRMELMEKRVNELEGRSTWRLKR